MSWMDSWSRPRKDQAVPAPYYIAQPDTKYCHTCGRTIGARRANNAKAKEIIVKYCSDKCKRHKPSAASDGVEVRIENALIELLEGRSVKPQSENDNDEDNLAIKAKFQPKKGDPRIILQLSEVEEAVFGSRQDPEKTFGRRRNRARRGVPDGPDWKSVDMIDDQTTSDRLQPDMTEEDGEWSDGPGGSTDDGERFETNGVSLRIRPSQAKSDVNFSVGGERGWAEKIDESPEMQQKRLEGQKKADEKEMVKQAARRAVVFGLPCPQGWSARRVPKARKKKTGKGDDGVDGGANGVEGGEPQLRKCEALMTNSVVEPSFAKGDWCIRWREE